MLPKKLALAFKQPQEGNVIVTCRFRPLNDKEKERSGDLNVEFPDNKTVLINQQFEGFGVQRFNYDYVFPPGSDQKTVYETTALPIVDAAMQGFNGTVFAYGQTSSGKTFTMSGPDIYDAEMKGIVPRMVETVFDRISKADENSEFLVKIGFCEIYNEKIKDLIDHTRKDLKVQEDKARGVYIGGLSEHYVNSGDELLNFMALGQANREVAFTLMNAGSSRSHSIFITTINQKSTKDYSEKTGKLFLVDLAGSEKVGKTGATGKVLEEAKNINKSLTTLGKVITSLTDGSTHIPYRDSKLTRVLQDSLGGNSKTALIITCSPSPFNESETVSTLRFGVRAKAIKNKPRVNKEFTVAELKLLLAKAEEEIAKRDKIILELKDLLKSSGISIPSFGEAKPEDEANQIHKELEEAKENLASEYVKNEALQDEFSNFKFSTAETIQNLQNKIAELETTLKFVQDNYEKTLQTNLAFEEEIQGFSVERAELEQKISSLEITLRATKDETSKDRKSAKDFEKELEKYFAFENKIKLAEDLLKSKLVESEDVTDLRNMLHTSLMQEKKDLNEAMLKVFLNDYFLEIDKLEEQVFAAESNYKDAMNLLSSDQSKLKKDMEKQNFQIENLLKLYNKLIIEKATFKVEQSLSQRKIEKLISANQELEEEITKLKECTEEITEKLSMKALEIVENIPNEESSIMRHKMIKPIIGGQRVYPKVDMKNTRIFTGLKKDFSVQEKIQSKVEAN